MPVVFAQQGDGFMLVSVTEVHVAVLGKRCGGSSV